VLYLIKYKNLIKIKNIVYYLLLVGFVFTSNHTYPEDWDILQNNEDWELIKNLENIDVFTKKIINSGLSVYKAELLSTLPSELLIQVAWEVENSVEIFPNAFIIEAGIYSYYSDSSYTGYQVFDIPFLSKRLYQFDSIRKSNSVFWNSTHNLGNDLNPNNLMLPPINFGSWHVKKSGDKSKLIYRLCTDPGGNVPLWIVDKATQKYIPQMLKDLEKFASNRLNSK